MRKCNDLSLGVCEWSWKCFGESVLLLVERWVQSPWVITFHWGQSNCLFSYTCLIFLVASYRRVRDLSMQILNTSTETRGQSKNTTTEPWSPFQLPASIASICFAEILVNRKKNRTPEGQEINFKQILFFFSWISLFLLKDLVAGNSTSSRCQCVWDCATQQQLKTKSFFLPLKVYGGLLRARFVIEPSAGV